MLDYKLETFRVLCKTMNYRVTAELLNMTQPAVTNHIQQLEQFFGCKLFLYQNRVLKKTLQCEILLDYANSAQYNQNQLLTAMTKKPKEVLRVGATRTIGEFVLNDKVAELMQQQLLDVDYFVENTANLLKKLQDGQLDFVFVEGFFKKSQFQTFDFREEKLVGICQRGHEFANKSVKVDDTFSQRLILREDGSGTREALERVLQQQNFDVSCFANKCQTSSFKAIADFVKKGLGISFVYQSVAEKTEGIDVFQLKNVDSTHQFACVQLKNTTPSKFLKHFLQD